MSEGIRTVRDLFDAAMAAKTEAEMRGVVGAEVTYCGGSRDTAFLNIRYTLGYGDPRDTRRAYQLLAAVDFR